jgi:two-component system cell cycle sensor histidine kinase/response regulator CckA
MPRAESDARILVVDDERAIRDWAASALARRGYSVVAVASASEALRILSAGAGDINLVLTDIKMPEIDGIELARRVRALHPNTKVIYMTGFSPEIVDPGSTVLYKPFTFKLLIDEVARVLAGRTKATMG